METKTLNAPAINCGHCVMAIKRAVTKLAGVSAVEGDPASKNVTVTYNAGEVSLEQIKATMAEAGYPAAG